MLSGKEPTVDENRQATLEIVVRALVATLVGRSDMRTTALKMIRDQAIATLDGESAVTGEERERLRASVDAFFRDVSESMATFSDRNSN
jgi:hypothetical protein